MKDPLFCFSDCGRVVEVSTPGMQHLSQQKPNLAISNELQILLVWGNHLINTEKIEDGCVGSGLVNTCLASGREPCLRSIPIKKGCDDILHDGFRICNMLPLLEKNTSRKKRTLSGFRKDVRGHHYEGGARRSGWLLLIRSLPAKALQQCVRI